MKFKCAKDEFQRTMSMTEIATTGKSGLQILSNVLIDARDGKLVIIGTDQEMGVIGQCEADIQKEGTLTIHARKVLDILKTFPNCDIQIEADEKYNISVTSLESNINANFRLQGVSPDEYPQVEQISNNNTFKVPQHILRDMISKTIYAASREESRYFLQGIFFEKKENSKELRLIATDGHRLSLTKQDLDGLQNYGEFGAMIPQKPLHELQKALANEGDCEIALTEKRCFFKVDKMEISSNFIETDFLNYNSVIPNNLKFRLIAENDRLLDSIKRVSSILEAKERRIKCEIKNDKLSIHGENPNMGEAKEILDIEYDGEDMVIGLNYEYMLQTLREVKGKNVVIEIGSNIQPIIVKEEDDNSSIAVIGPMRLG